MRHSWMIPLSALLFSAFAGARDASACAAFFEETVTPIAGHKMVLSISQDSTTLWDQFDYTGDPASFAWVFPIKGQVDVGISADGLFQALEQTTAVTVEGISPDCFNGSGGGDGGGGIEIIDQSVVGPFEQVQLTAQDPQELINWLTSHGYVIPAAVQPIIGEYISEGFGFLAMKLVPGVGVDKIKPVRVTFPGAAPMIPLRLLRAGTSGDVPVNLWVFAEGRWEPSNFPTFTINEKDLLWNWDTETSNYSELRAAGFAAGAGKAWLVSSAHLVEPSEIATLLQDQALSQYADENGMNAQAGLDADMAALYSKLSPGDVWVNHFVGIMSQEALASDMTLQASLDQTPVSGYLVPSGTTGSDPCPEGSGGTGGGTAGTGGVGTGGGGAGSGGNGSGGKANAQDEGGCQIGASNPTNAAGLALALGAALAMFRRRRRS
ncbi:MAG: DUF2330 domain-containing protein [Polyangiaceae bacterium]|nr:DUF2330 domain-containing protein [Polyangiaceae bacterium]